MALIRGSIVSFAAGTWLADVRLDGSAPQVLAGIKTARNIASAEMSANRRVIVDTGDAGHADDYLVIAVFTA